METGRGVLATAVAAPADLCFAANQHTDIRREQKKAEKLIKDAAKRQDIASARASSSGRLQRAGTTAGRHHSWPAPQLAGTTVHTNRGSLAPPCLHSNQVLAKEYVHMRRTIAKLAMNKASMLALSNQMTEQLGEQGGRWWAGADGA